MAADSASEFESDASSLNDCPVLSTARLVTPNQIDYMQKRIESLQQENVVLKTEVERYKQRVKTLEDDNVRLRRASVSIQARAEQEEEYISNTLLKTIETLKKDKEDLAMKYEQEEECLTNDLSRKLFQLQKEKSALERTLEHEQQKEISKLKKNTERLEAEIKHKQSLLEELRRDKVQLENDLEHEQEALVNRLWKRMSSLESEKRRLQEQLSNQGELPSPRSSDDDNMTGQSQNEIFRLRRQVANLRSEHERRKAELETEEKKIKEENNHLQCRLNQEIERRELLRKHLSESESSLDMDDEKYLNDLVNNGNRNAILPSPVSIRCSSCSQKIVPISPDLNSEKNHFLKPNQPATQSKHLMDSNQ